MHVFSDHAGVIIDPFGVGLANQTVNHATTIPDMRGVRISPRQSPVYQSSVLKNIELIFFLTTNYLLCF